MADEFWLSDRQWPAIEPHLPKNQPGARRVDDRRVISSITHVLKSDCRWRDVPVVYGPPKTIYNRWHHLSQKGRPHSALGYTTPAAYAAQLAEIDDRLRERTRSADRPLLPRRS